jgi:hypothetical protein
MRRKTPDLRAWPFGKPTVLCADCGGSGLNAASAARYAGSRASFGDDRRLAAEQVSCSGCEGRGRRVESAREVLARTGRST